MNKTTDWNGLPNEKLVARNCKLCNFYEECRVCRTLYQCVVRKRIK